TQFAVEPNVELGAGGHFSLTRRRRTCIVLRAAGNLCARLVSSCTVAGTAGAGGAAARAGGAAARAGGATARADGAAAGGAGTGSGDAGARPAGAGQRRLSLLRGRVAARLGTDRLDPAAHVVELGAADRAFLPELHAEVNDFIAQIVHLRLETIGERLIAASQTRDLVANVK